MELNKPTETNDQYWTSCDVVTTDKMCGYCGGKIINPILWNVYNMLHQQFMAI